MAVYRRFCRMIKTALFALVVVFVSANAFACNDNQIEYQGECIDSEFEIETTDMPAGFTVQIGFGAYGTFYVDWGDGSEPCVKTFVRNVSYSVGENSSCIHKYTTSGSRLIKMSGQTNDYMIGNDADHLPAIYFYSYNDYDAYLHNSSDALKLGAQWIKKIYGSLGHIFRTVNINGQLKQPLFKGLFKDAVITEIPAELFDGVYGSGRKSMFKNAFAGTKITRIPSGLFKDITSGAEEMFSQTFMFNNGTGNIYIPIDLFSNLTGPVYEGMFFETFSSDMAVNTIAHFVYENNDDYTPNYVPYNFLGALYSETDQEEQHMFGYQVVFDGPRMQIHNCGANLYEYDTGLSFVYSPVLSCAQGVQIYLNYDYDNYSNVDVTGTTILYTSYNTGDTNGVYFDEERRNKILPTTNGITKPIAKATADKKIFAGYYGTNGVQYIDGNGKITQAGIDAASTYIENTSWNAKWLQESYNIQYNLNGGEYGQRHPDIVELDELFTVDDPTREGWYFNGWTISGMDSGQHTCGGYHFYGTSYSDRRLIDCTRLRSSSGNVLLTANWRKTCSDGTYFRASDQSCQKCPSGYYCYGPVVDNDVTEDVGKEKCPTNYPESEEGSYYKTQCYKSGTTTCAVANPASVINGTVQYAHSGSVACKKYNLSAEEDYSISEYCLPDIGVCDIIGVSCNNQNDGLIRISSPLASLSINETVVSHWSISDKTRFSNTNDLVPDNTRPYSKGYWYDKFNNYSISGYSLCSDTEGTKYEPGNPSLTNKGNNCWCKAAYYYDNSNNYQLLISDWVKSDETFGSVNSCEEDCTSSCSSLIGWDSDMKTPIYNQSTTYMCQPSCSSNQMLYNGGCADPDFTLTTTSDTSEFAFDITASGTWYVDWGDGTVEQIHRENIANSFTNGGVDNTRYYHAYDNDGTYVIKMKGLATDYSGDDEIAAINFSSAGYEDYIASISGSLGKMFPTIDGTSPSFKEVFNDAENLVGELPSDLFSEVTTCRDYMFQGAFTNSEITKIPSGLFSSITDGCQSMFEETFENCDELTTVEQNAFPKTQYCSDRMYAYTFDSCPKLTSIPSDLFENQQGGCMEMFENTFSSSGLTSIPEELFASIIYTGEAMFDSTFAHTKITEVPSNLFPNIEGTDMYLFGSMFAYCENLTTIPADLFSHFDGSMPSENAFNNMFIADTNMEFFKYSDGTKVSYIPSTFFGGLEDSGYTGGDNVAKNMFGNASTYSSYSDGVYVTKSNNTKILETCPAGTTVFNSVFKNEYAPKVSCVPISSYTITYNLNSGSFPVVAVIPSEYTNSDLPLTLPTPVRDGYTFGGWYDNSGLTGNAITSIPANSIGNKEFWAKWTVNTYTITYHLSGGTNDIGNPASYTVESQNITFAPPTKTGYIYGGWFTDSEFTTQIEGIQTGSTTGNKNLYVNWVDDKFQLTTKPSTTSFDFYISAAGKFYVDWGDGTTDIITKSVGRTQYSHTYASAGEYTIHIGGRATGYDTTTMAEISCFDDSENHDTGAAISFAVNNKINTISGSLGSIFGTLTNGQNPSFNGTFAASSLSGTIPSTLFTGIYGAPTAGMFKQTFENCDGLTGTIPATLFSGLYGAPAEQMFNATFSGCSGLTGSIPGTLFCQNTENPNATNCIYGAPAQEMFEYTFENCSNLSSYIPPTLFVGISQSTTATDQMTSVFYDSGIATSCEPYGMQQYMTGFESWFDGKVSCAPAGYTITYVLDGGTNNENNPLTYTEDSPTITLANPTKTNYFFDGWYTDANFTLPITQIEHGSTGNKTLYAKWLDAKFILTTTSTTTSFQFKMSAAGNFTVDCGDNGTLSSEANDVTNNNTITRNDTNEVKYTCQWASAGAHQIKFGGAATGYNNSNTPTAAIRFNIKDDGMYSSENINVPKIASISGSLGQIFGTVVNPTTGIGQPKYKSTFYNAVNMSGNIPVNLFDGVSGAPVANMFGGTFAYCSKLTGSIPATLFSGISGAPAQSMFPATFWGCSGLTGSIPATLFAGISGAPAESMFSYTFSGCSGLTGSIPSGLFGNISGAPAQSMFAGTFDGCSGLTGSIPATLFAGIHGAPATNMFKNTFNGCSNLSGYIPPTLFAGISKSTTATDQMTGVFANSGLATSCEPYNMVQYMTGFESYFDGKVSCMSDTSTVTLYQNITDNDDTVNGTVIAHYNTAMPSVDENNQTLTAPTQTGKIFMGYFDARVGGTKYYNVDMSSAQNWDGINTAGKLYAHWGTGKFQLTTTEINHFEFKMSAAGNFTIDWGDGNVETITRNNTTETTYSHDYNAYKSYIISFDGEAEGYDNASENALINDVKAAIGFNINGGISDTNVKKIAGISGSLGQIFGTVAQPTTGTGQPKFKDTFAFASNMRGSIPSGLFDNLSGSPASHMFYETFRDCSGLTGSIPANLFSGISGASKRGTFLSTFDGCSGLTGSIPATLFAGIHGTPANGMFEYTFRDCSGLTGSIPATLFCQNPENPDTTNCIYGAPREYMFDATFNGCSGLTGSIPATLFAGIHGAPAQRMFSSTFKGCGGLTGAIPATLFCQNTENPDATNCISGAPAQSMFYSTFSGCSNLSGYIPPTLFAGISKSTTATDQMTSVFASSGLATSCAPYGMQQYMTGFESYFNGKVSCEKSYPFSLTTTSNTDHFEFKMSAAGEFYVDWGDGTVETISRTNNLTETLYTHDYDNAGAYTIRFGGEAKGYSSAHIPGWVNVNVPVIRFKTSDNLNNYLSDTNAAKIASISGSLGAIFKTLSSASIGTTQPMFNLVFSGATNMIGSIPANLFNGVSGAPIKDMFYRTFSACSNLTGSIPSNLFGNLYGAPAFEMFHSTFYGCSKLTGPIPETLFSGIYGTPAERMFLQTFYGCSSLTGSIPAILFKDISGTPAPEMFHSTFEGCSSLSSYIPPILFANISKTSSATDQMTNMFYNSGLATSCEPYNMSQYMTGFESYWNYPNATTAPGQKVSCDYAPMTVNLYQNSSTSDNNINATISAIYGQPMPQYDTSDNRLVKPTLSGYTFAGYFDARSGGSKYYNANMTSTKNWDKTSATPLYAHWTGSASGCETGYEKLYTMTNIDGSDFSYDKNTFTWSVVFPYGTINGGSACLTNNGKNKGKTDSSISADIADSEGQYCWCKVTSPEESLWTYNYKASSQSGCNTNCARLCANYTSSQSELRTGLFSSSGDVGNYCVGSIYTCPAGQYLNVDYCETCEAGHYCPGDGNGGAKTYSYNGEIQGREDCKANSTSPVGSTAASACVCRTGFNTSTPNATISGEVLSSGDSKWSVEFPYGILSGHSICVAASGSTRGQTTSGAAHVSVTGEEEGGKYCWCQMDSLAQSVYTYAYTATTEEVCNRNCPSKCATNIAQYEDMRTGLFSGINNMCTAPKYTCPAGQYLNIDECEVCEVGHWCPGGTWYFNEEIQGRYDCQPTYSTSSSGSDDVSDCHCVSDASDLREELDVNGTEHTVDGDDWTATFYYGKISGTSACLNYKKSTKGTTDPDATAEPGDRNGKYCWCKMTFPVNGYWTYNYETANDSACDKNCATYCANYTKTQEQLRNGVFFSQYNTTCMPDLIHCNAGQYLPRGQRSCVICPANKYCPEGNYVVSTVEDQGINDCPTNSYSAAGSETCTCNSGYVDLLQYLDEEGTNINWNTSDATWSTVFDYVSIRGISACLDESERVQGTVKPEIDADAGDATGAYCYCKMNHPGELDWTYNYTASSTDACVGNCARMCATNARNKQNLRTGLYTNGQAKLCLPSRFYINYTLNGGYGCETDQYTYGTEKEITCEPLRAGYSFQGWFDTDTFDNEVTVIPEGTIGDQTLYAKWQAISYPFNVEVTTAEDNTEFVFKLSASGVFHINWGDGTVDVIEKQDVLNRNYTHTYEEAGDYTIGISGIPSAYSESSSAAAISFTNNEYITGISGSLGSLFPTLTTNVQKQHPIFHSTFYGCSNLSGNIPENLFAGITGTAPYMFYATFKDCPKLTGSIPANLFATISGNIQEYMFSNTFNGCSSLSGSIPANLFRGITGTPQHSMFYSTFARCSGLTGSIPADLFCYNQSDNICISGAPAKSMFFSTFNGCSSLSGSIPAGLFRGITGAPETNMFDSTFAGDENLTGNIPSNLFCYDKQHNICISGAPANSMFSGTFSECSGLTGSIPATLFQEITGQPARSMFRSTFYGCDGLSGSIPSNLFCYDKQHNICISGAPAENMFNSTFAGCSSLTGSIPEELFEGVSGAPAENMFKATFKNATGLESYIPAYLFKDILTLTQAENQMLEIFNSTNLLEEYPAGTILYTTGFEEWFDDKVACAPVYDIIYDYTNGGGGCPNETYARGTSKTLDCDAYKEGYIFIGWFDESDGGDQIFEISSSASGNITLYAQYVEEGDNLYMCNAGTYLPATKTTCRPCLQNNYCPGVSGVPVSNLDQGIFSCPTGLFSPQGMQNIGSCGRILHIGNESLYLNSVKRTERALVIDTDEDGLADFYGNMSTVENPISLYSERKLHVGDYYVYDDSLLTKLVCEENDGLWDETTLTCKSNIQGNTYNSSFSSAKNKLLENIYFDHRETFYCHASFDENKTITLPSGFTTPAYENRKTVLEIEHVVPAENFGSNFTEWTVGDPRCVHNDGTPYKGRACAELVNVEFKYMISDLYNLYPSIGSVNAMRSNYPFAELSDVSDYTFGTCQMKISGGYAEPPVYTRGAIARTYLYFDAAYPKYTMPASTRNLMNVWNVLYPVTEWECLRATRIENIQGNSNYFVKRQCLIASF